MFFSKQVTWSAEDFCNIKVCHMNSNSDVDTVVHSLRGAKNLKHLMMGVGWENILFDIVEASDALVAAALRPLAEDIYHNQENKDKQGVLATFCFGNYVDSVDEEGELEHGGFEETEYTAKLEIAVGGRLYDFIPDGEMKIVKMKIAKRKLKAFWQVQDLMEEFPGIRQAVKAGAQHVTSATSYESAPSSHGQDRADHTMPDVDMVESETESNDSEDEESSSGDEESMIDDEGETDESDDSDDRRD